MRAHAHAALLFAVTSLSLNRGGRSPVRRSRRRLAVATLACLLAALVWAPAALAHARVVATSPESGATITKQPAEVIFKFDQPVSGTAGAIRVYDAAGNEVDNLDVTHPGGRQSWMGVGLKPKLPDGTYTATYRVVSADTHIVYGGFVFNIGHAGAKPKLSVTSLVGREESGEVTKLGFGLVRALDYLTIALMVGGLAFFALAWRRGLAAARGARSAWDQASRACERRLGWLLAVAVVGGIVVSLVGILLQGASEAGVSLWASLKSSIISDTLDSRFGTVWLIRAAVWAGLGCVTVAAARLPAAHRWLALPLALGCAYLAMTPALAGHASIESPVAVFFPADFLHVLAASVWVGGIACLLFALPAATRRLEGAERSGLLTEVLVRFSPLALASVLAIALSGVIQAYIDVRTVSALFNTTYGLLILAKVALLAALIGLGALNRQRLIPALRRLAERAAAPGRVGVTARRSFRAELALMLVVFGVTAALVSYAPPIDAAQGPFSTSAKLGPAELEMTIEPAAVGLNTVHLYLINAASGTQFTRTKQLTATATLPSKRIGPLPLQVNRAGPGHYILNDAQLSPGGTWELEITDRVSAFDEYTTKVSVPIR